MRSNLSKHNFFDDNKNLYKHVRSSAKDLDLKVTISKPGVHRETSSQLMNGKQPKYSATIGGESSDVYQLT